MELGGVQNGVSLLPLPATSLYTGDAPCEPWTAEKGLAAASKGKETQNRLWIATCILGLWGVQSV